MCPEYAHIQKTKQIAHHDVYGRFCEQNAGTFRHQTFGPCVSPTALFDRLRKWSVLRRAPQTFVSFRGPFGCPTITYVQLSR